MRNFSPRSTLENEIAKVFLQKRFDGGQNSDVEANEIGFEGTYPRCAREMVNVRGFSDGFAGVPGTVRHTIADFAVSITDNLQSFYASLSYEEGEIYIANNNATPSVNDYFEVLNDGDFIADDLEAAKGDKVRPYDLFKILMITGCAATLEYIGNVRIPAVPGFGDTTATEIVGHAVDYGLYRDSGPNFTSALVGCFWVHDSGSRDYIDSFVGVSELGTIHNSTVYVADTRAHIEPPLNASYVHQTQSKIVILAGANIYVSKGIPITGWTKALVLNEAALTSAQSVMYEDGDDVVLLNASGEFRIVLASTPYAWRMNETPPTHTFVSESETVANDGEVITNGYRSLYTMSRIYSSTCAVLNYDRTGGASGAVVEQESAPTPPDSNGLDYSEKWQAEEVGASYPIEFGLTAPASPNHWTHYSRYRTKNINAAGISAGNRENVFVWTKDIPVARCLTCSKAADKSITVTHGTLSADDIGSTIVWQDGKTDVIKAVLSPTSATGDSTQVASSQSAGIGGGTVFTMRITGGAITVESGYSLQASDVGKPIFLADGYVIYIKSVTNSTTAIALVNDSHVSQAAMIDPVSRKFNDTVTDATLQIRIKSGKYMYILQNRFFQALPSASTGVLTAGFLFVATRGEGTYYYCETGKKYLTGYHQVAKQFSDKIYSGIQHIRPYPDKIIIRCIMGTWKVMTNITYEGGDTDLGESYQILPDPVDVEGSLGVVGEHSAIRIPNGTEIVFTTEPALRVFDGTTYGNNIASRLIQKEINKLKVPIHMSYSTVMGFHIWGIRGLTTTTATSTPEIGIDANKKCYHYGLKEEQGGGWYERSGSTWVWPESRAAIMSIILGNYPQEIIYDVNDGLPYVIDTRIATIGAVMEMVWKDKVDPNVAGSGTDIDWSILFGEMTGSDAYPFIELLEILAKIRPYNQDYINASGYDTEGLPSSFEVNAQLLVDGKETVISEADEITTKRETVFDRKTSGDSIQIKLSGACTAFRIRSILANCKLVKSKRFTGNNTTEQDLQAEGATPILRVSRYDYTINMANGGDSLFAGTKKTGPDGEANSAIRVSQNFSLHNAAYAAGTLLFWRSNDFGIIPEVALSEYGVWGSWKLVYCKGAIPANLTANFSLTDIFDFWLLDISISDDWLAYYYDNLINHSGDVFLP